MRDHMPGSTAQPFQPLGPSLYDLKRGDRIILKDYPEWEPYTVDRVSGGTVYFHRPGTRTRGSAPVGSVEKVR